MPILAATTIGSLSPNAQAIWRAQPGVARRNILVIREEDFPTTSTFSGLNFSNYFGQAWRNTAANASDVLYDSMDRAGSYLSLWDVVVSKLNQDSSLEYILYDFPSVIGIILEDNFYDDRPTGSLLNLIENLNNNFVLALKTHLLGRLNVPRDIKIGMAGIPCVNRWRTVDNGANYQRISSRDLTDVAQEISNKFFNTSDPKWIATSNLLRDLDFMLIDGRDFLSWNDGESTEDRSDYIKQISYLAKSLPAPAGPIGTEKEILCIVSDHEFLPPFRRARFPALTRDWRVRPAVAALNQFKDPPPAEMRSFVYFDFSKQSSVTRFVNWNGNPNTQTRAGSLGINDPATFSNWREFIINQIKPWYQWGQRRFWLHFPFGRPNQSGVPGSINAPESGINQMDSWIAAKYGQVINGTVVNNPMPWITEDFVGSWHYMCTGQSFENSTELFNLNRHQSFDLANDSLFSWFNPLDPIEVVGFVGSPVSHITSSHPDAMSRINSMDPDRFQLFINDCYEPILWSGMSIGFDKGSLGPQAWPGKSVSTYALNGHLCNCTGSNDLNNCYMNDNLQSVWYRWASDLARRHPKRIYMGGVPKKLSVIDSLEPVAQSNLGFLDNDYRLFSFVCDDYEYVSLTENAAINNVHERSEYVSRKQEVVRYAFNDFIPVSVTNQAGGTTLPLEFSSLLSDSAADSVPIELPGGTLVSGLNITSYYKTNNDGSGTLADPWKIFYARHVIMKKRALTGQTIEPLYSSLIEHDKFNTINSILQASGFASSISGYSSWLKANIIMRGNPASVTANTLLFYPRIVRFYSSNGGIISDHEQVVDSVLPAISGCVDGFVLDSLSNARIFKAFSASSINDSDNFGIVFHSRRVIKNDFFANRALQWNMTWSGSDSIDDRGIVEEITDENALSTIISISNPSYESCVCDGAGVIFEDALSSSSSSSSFVVSSSSSSSESAPLPPAQFISSFYSLVNMRSVQGQGEYNSWNCTNNSIFFIGKPEPNGFSPVSQRAFAWECDPANPEVSSPWHNVIYESVIDQYQWGSRAFEIFMPFGDYDASPMHFSVGRNESDPKDYIFGSSFLSLKFWEEEFASIPAGLASPNEIIVPPLGSQASKDRLNALAACPCRWKGFKQAIKALVEGRLSPDPSTGRLPIDEPCKVSLYLNGIRGFGGYRYRSNLWWDKYFYESRDANPAAAFHVHASYADTKFYQDLDYVIQQFVEMKGAIPGTENNIQVGWDVGSGCATPSDAFLWAPSWMLAGGSVPTNQDNPNLTGPEDGQPDYRTEALELSDWYVITRLQEMGINTFIETRPQKYTKRTQVFSTAADNPSLTFPNVVNPRTNLLVPNGSETTATERSVNPSGQPVTSAEFGWDMGWSNKAVVAVDSTFANYESIEQIFGVFMPFEEIPSYHKLSFSNVYPPYDNPTPNPMVRQTSDFYGDKKTLTFQGNTVSIRSLSPSSGYGPYWFLWQLYPIVDTYRYVYNQINGNLNDIKGIVWDIPQSAVYDTMKFMRGLFSIPIFDGVRNYHFQYHRLPESFFDPNESWMESQRIFNESQFLSNPSGYTGGLWTIEGRNFWNTNIRSSSFDEFINMLHSVATNGAPIKSEDQGWSGDIYPNDFYSKGVISNKLFGSEGALPIAPTPVVGRESLPWFQSSDISLQYQYSAFDAVLFCEAYVYKIPGAQQGGTPPQVYQSPLSFCALKDMDPGCASTSDDGPFYKIWQLTGSLPPGWVFGSANASTLTELRQDFASRIGIDRTIRAMSLSGPDMIVVFIKGGGEPLWWDTQIPGLRQFPLFADDGTGADAIGLAIDILQEYKDASNKYKCKLIGYFFPFAWIELNDADYPLAKDIINRNIREGRHGPNISFRSIFKGAGINMDYVNHLVAVHVELAERYMDRETGYGFHGVHWDSSPVYYALDFSPAAKAASGIDTNTDFPFPLTEGTELYNYLIFGPEFNGNVASIMLKTLNPSVGWTDAVRSKLESYIYAIREKEGEFVRLVREGIDTAGFDDFIVLPALISSTYSYELPMNSEYMLPYTSGQKTEIGVEQYVRRKQPSNISTPFGVNALPDFWLGLYHDLLTLNGRNGKRTLAWQIGQWIQPAGMIVGRNCDQTYFNCITAFDALYGNPSQVGFYYGNSIGVLPRDVAVRGWLENHALLCLASHTSIEFMYGFYDWSQYDAPSGLDDFSNTANAFAVQHLPFMRKISSVIRSIKDSKLQLDNRSNATWCLIMTRNEYLWKQGIYPPGNVPPNYARIWPIIGAVQTCVEHGVPHTVVHDATFKAADYDNAPILLIPVPAAELPLEVQQQIELFSGKVIFMEEEYVGASPRLENNFHNTTVDIPSGKTRAQISREKLWDLMVSDGTAISIQTSIEIPGFLPEKPSPLASYEIGNDHFGNSAINIIMMADASWHDVRKHAFYIDWNNGPEFAVDGLCGRQNLLYTQVITNGGPTPVRVEDGGYRRILDTCNCPDGFNRDCYFVDYTSSGSIPINVLPARGKLNYYAGYPPVLGNLRSASVSMNAKQKPLRVRQLLLNPDKGYFDPIDMYVDSDQFDLISFEQGSLAQIQFKNPNSIMPHMGICVEKTSLVISNLDDYVTFLESLSSTLSPTNNIFVLMRCDGITKSKGFNAIQLLTQMSNDAILNQSDYAWIDENHSALCTPSDYWPIGFVEADVSNCAPGQVSISGIIFQKEGICTIAKRIPLIAVDANDFNTPLCGCAANETMTRIERVPYSQDDPESNLWDPLIEASLFKKSQFAHGSFLTIKPISDNTDPFFNVDANGLPIATGILAYLRSIDNEIKSFTQNQKTIADLYSGIILDFYDAFDIDQEAIHPRYCASPHTVQNEQENGYMEARRSIADVNGTFMKTMSKIRLEFPGTLVSARWMGNFGSGNAIQNSKDDPISFSIVDPEFDTRTGLQRRISEAYGPLLEASDFIPIEKTDGTALSTSAVNSSVAYIRNHFVERNSTASGIYESLERKPIFAAAWLPTDHTVWPSGSINGSIPQDGLGALTYNNVNLYSYVKPMIALFNCTNTGGFHESTASDFINGVSCPSRFSSIVSALSSLPEDMRVLRTTRYDQGQFFANPSDRYADGNQSPFAFADIDFVYNDFATIAQALIDNNAVPSHIALDCENGATFSAWSYGTSLSSQNVDNIINDVKWDQAWFESPSPAYMFNYGDLLSHTVDNIKTGTGSFHPQNNPAYLYWNQVMASIFHGILEQSIVKASRDVLGVYNVSNYSGNHSRRWDHGYDPNGHPYINSSIVGNAQSAEFYAGFNQDSIYKILNSDPTRIVRTDATGYGAGTSINSTVNDSWFQMLILVQKIRAMRRATPHIPIRPWIAPRTWSSGYWNAKWAIDSYGFKMYNETIRHFALTGVDVVYYWNGAETTTTVMQQNLVNINTVMNDINVRMGGWTLQILDSSRISFNANYIISGAVAADGSYLWRVTPKPGITLIDENANSVIVDSDGGTWIVKTDPSVPVFTV